MASTNKTPNLGLNQWLESDPFQVEDFNADNAKIDAAVAGGAKIKVGSYVGDGKYGEENKIIISCDFTPHAIIISDNSGYTPGMVASNGIYPNLPLIAIRGMTSGFITAAYYNNTTVLNWNDHSVEWYGNDSLNGATIHINQKNIKYYYIVLGA